jgi:hypothetical protein
MKMRCGCGKIISTGLCPNPDGFLVLKEADADAVETEATDATAVSDIFDAIGDRSVQGYRCPSCGRLLLFEAGRGGAITFFKQEP